MTDGVKPPEIVPDLIRDHVRLIHMLAEPFTGRGKIVVAGFGEDPNEIDSKTGKPGRRLAAQIVHAVVGNKQGSLAGLAQFMNRPHQNMYMPLAIFQPGLHPRAKGFERDVVACLGIVADFDDPDAARWAERLPIPPNYVLETSAGRFQAFYLLDKPEPLEVVKPVAERLKAFAGCDHGTSDMSHVWRVPGTMNWPNAKKVAEGRAPDPQLVRVVKWDAGRTSLQALSDALPQSAQTPKQKETRAPTSSGRRPRCLDAALEYANLGFSVIPLYGIDERGVCTCGKLACYRAGKHPIGNWKKYRTERLTPEQLTDAFYKHPDANVGIVTGSISGILVIDSEGPEALDSFSSSVGDSPLALPMVKTARGYHHYARHLAGGHRGFVKINPGLADPDDGYVVAPPSRHHSGHEYTWTTGLTSPLPDLPPQLLNLFIAFDEQPTGGIEGAGETCAQEASLETVNTTHNAAIDGTPENLDALERMQSLPSELQQEIRQPAPGDRSKALFRVIARLIKEGLDDDAIENIITAHPNGIGEKYAGRDDLDKEIGRVRTKTTTRPVVQVTGGRLPWVVDEAEERLLESDHDLYQRGSLIVRPVQEFIPVTNGRQIVGNRLTQVRQQHMREAFSREVDFQKLDRRSNAWLSIDCPRDVADAYLEREGKWRLPLLTRVITAPTLRDDGSILETPGYDEQTGLLFDPQGVSFPPVPVTPNAAIFRAANDLLELIKTFPFADEPSRAVALSAILTSLIRSSLPSAPLHAFTAPTRGSGKSLLMDVASMIATGHETPVMAQGRTAEEFEKRLGAAFIAGDATIAIDNCEQPLGGEFLCQVLTQPRAAIRVLGQSKNVFVPTNASLFATGNNLRIVGDLTRRALVCSLDPGCERPELRKFPVDVLELVRQERPRYVIAALSILRFAALEELPQWCTPAPFGSFEKWSQWVRAAVIWMTSADPCETMEHTRAQDPELERLRSVIHKWETVIGVRPITALEVIEIATKQTDAPLADGKRFVNEAFREALLAVAGNAGSIDSRRLGTWLGAIKDRIVDGKKIALGKMSSGSNQWQLIDSAAAESRLCDKGGSNPLTPLRKAA